MINFHIFKNMNNQSTIDCFFKLMNNGKEVQVRKYFYLKWTNKFSPDFDAVWLMERPSKVNFIQHVNCDFIKKGFYFYICGYFDDYESDEYIIYKETKYKNISFLKSHLQKNIRKKDSDKAIASSLHLMKLDLNEFLRRMIIIHIEDTFLHNSITTLIWLMIAYSTKKFKMKKYIYEWLLGFVFITCTTNKCDNYDKKIKNMCLKEYRNNYEEFISYENLNLNEKQLSIIYSLYIRIAYGGMDSDKIMIKKCINLWKTRFINNTISYNKMKIKPINIFVRELPIDNWDYSAIDFHTNKNLIDFILKKFPYIQSPEEIKKIIWYNSSSINYRKDNLIYKKDTWNDIKEYVGKTQKYLLETNY